MSIMPKWIAFLAAGAETRYENRAKFPLSEFRIAGNPRDPLAAAAPEALKTRQR
jgi:hypothetical protein